MKIFKLFLFAIFFIAIGVGFSKYMYMQSIYSGSHENSKMKNIMNSPIEGITQEVVPRIDIEKLKAIVLPFYLSLDPKNPESASGILEKTLAPNYISYSQ